MQSIGKRAAQRLVIARGKSISQFAESGAWDQLNEELEATQNEVKKALEENRDTDLITLVSIGGPNTLEGLGGDDLYFLNNSADVVIEAADGGTDIVGATVDYTLPDNSYIELLSMLGSGLTGRGSAGRTSTSTPISCRSCRAATSPAP